MEGNINNNYAFLHDAVNEFAKKRQAISGSDALGSVSSSSSLGGDKKRQAQPQSYKKTTRKTEHSGDENNNNNKKKRVKSCNEESRGIKVAKKKEAKNTIAKKVLTKTGITGEEKVFVTDALCNVVIEKNTIEETKEYHINNIARGLTFDVDEDNYD